MTEPSPAASDLPAWVPATLHSAWQELQGNVRLRLGLWAVLAILWGWALLTLQDQAQLWRSEALTMADEVQRLRPLQAAKVWSDRAEDARKHLEAARAMLWTAPSQGLAEAELQDMLRNLAAKAGLVLREVTVVSLADAKPLPAQNKALRARLVVDVTQRIALMGLLNELQRSPRVMLVDTLRFRPLASPAARAELEVRVLFQVQERVP